MIPFARYVRGLASDDDLVVVPDTGEVPIETVAGEALRAGGPAVRYERPEGVDLVSGAFSGPDQMRRRDVQPWSRVALGIGCDADASLVETLRALHGLGPAGDPDDPTFLRQSASRVDADLGALELPKPAGDVWPFLTLGVASVSVSGNTHWAPTYGAVVSGDALRVHVPASLGALVNEGATVAIALGVSPAAVATTYLLAVTDNIETPIRDCGVAGRVPLVPTNGGVVPSDAEVVVESTVTEVESDFRATRREAWEHVVESVSLSLSVERMNATDDPVIPFSPLEKPLADDLQLTGLTTAAVLYHRVNNYWGISPVEWLSLPAAGELGLCVVASEILYAGFEWQLANILFSFSSLFDTVAIVDADVPPTNFGRVLSELWVKAHPSRDWIFSEPNAPAADRPRYADADRTGVNLYIDATWDPRWQDTYVAPRVTFDQSFPADVRQFARECWANRDDSGGA